MNRKNTNISEESVVEDIQSHERTIDNDINFISDEKKLRKFDQSEENEKEKEREREKEKEKEKEEKQEQEQEQEKNENTLSLKDDNETIKERLEENNSDYYIDDIDIDSNINKQKTSIVSCYSPWELPVISNLQNEKKLYIKSEVWPKSSALKKKTFDEDLVDIESNQNEKMFLLEDIKEEVPNEMGDEFDEESVALTFHKRRFNNESQPGKICNEEIKTSLNLAYTDTFKIPNKTNDVNTVKVNKEIGRASCRERVPSPV